MRNGIANDVDAKKREGKEPGVPGPFTHEEKKSFAAALERYKKMTVDDKGIIEDAWAAFSKANPTKSDSKHEDVSNPTCFVMSL